MPLQRLINLDLTLVGQQATGAKHHPPTGFEQAPSVIQQLFLQFDQRTKVRSVLGMRQIRVAADRASGRTRCVQQNRIKLPLKLTCILDKSPRRQARPRKVLFHPLHARMVVVHRAHFRAGRGKLHRLATRCRAEVQHNFTRLRVQN